MNNLNEVKRTISDNNVVIWVSSKMRDFFNTAARLKGFREKDTVKWIEKTLDSAEEFTIIDPICTYPNEVWKDRKLKGMRLIVDSDKKEYWQFMAKDANLKFKVWAINKLFCEAKKIFESSKDKLKENELKKFELFILNPGGVNMNLETHPLVQAYFKKNNIHLDEFINKFVIRKVNKKM